MYTATLFLLSLFCLHVAAAPKPFIQRRQNALSANNLIQNGKAAQALNSAFQSLSEGDACNTTTDTVACVKGSLASCSSSNQWKVTKQCSFSTSCFAIPSVREQGNVTVQCTSERQALSVIDATGATGGVFAQQGSSSNSTSSDSDDDGTCEEDDSGSDDDDSCDDGSDDSTTEPTQTATTTTTRVTSMSTVTVTDTTQATVTITVTTPAATESVVTETVQTLTISPEEASRIIAEASSTTQPAAQETNTTDTA